MHHFGGTRPDGDPVALPRQSQACDCVSQAVSPKHAFGTDMAAIETALTSSKRAVASEGGMGAINSAALTAYAAQAKLGLQHKYSQGLEVSQHNRSSLQLLMGGCL